MKRNMEQQWDEQIRAMAKADTHPHTEHLEQRLERMSGHLTDIQPIRRSRMWRKLAITAAAVACIASVSVVASSKTFTTWFASSAARPEYTTLPTAKQCQKDIGYTPILLQEFSNGYAFADASVVSNALGNDSSTLEKFKSMEFRYQKDGEEVLFSQDRYEAEPEETSGRVICREDGMEYRYNSFINKYVPVGYEMTEEDKAQEASGAVIFNEGSDTVEQDQVQGLSWSDGDMHYNLTQINGSLSAEELLDMAQELMEQ